MTDILSRMAAVPDQAPSGQQQAPQGILDRLASVPDAPPVQAKPQPVQPLPKEPGKLMSAAMGAGTATGKSALAVQQIVGKMTTWLGDTSDTPSISDFGNWLQKDAVKGALKLETENAPYEEANPKSNLAGQVGALVASPINKVMPGGPAKSLIGAVGQGAAQGAVLNALSTPVTDEDKSFIGEKIKQGTVGAMGGGIGGGIGYGISQLLNKGLEAFRSLGNRATTVNPGKAADDVVNKTLTDVGVDPAAVKEARPELFNGIRGQVRDALAAGKTVDKNALERLTQAQTLPVPVPMLKGQISRNPMQYAMEQNLRGIQGVGEPITQTLTDQNRALIANLDELGAKSGTDVVSAGKTAIDTLKSADKVVSKSVTNAYKAFKDATGKDLDVPLSGLAQDYANTVKEFGDAVPSAIRNKFESLGLMSGTAKKVFSIEDAEGLIKSINKNYDPSNRVQARALDELRQGVQKAIADGTGDSAQGSVAAGLAKAARQAAAQRFSLIDSTPALKEALRGGQPDKFIQKYILQGNEADIKSMMDVIQKQDPQAAKELQDSVMSFIKSKVTNLQNDGAFSQAQFKNFVKNPNVAARLTQVLGPEKMAVLNQLNSVAENALYAPVASAVNRSNTASAAANLVRSEVQGGSLNSLLDIAKKVPGLSYPAQKAQESVQQTKAGELINEAVNPSISKQSGATPIGSLATPSARAGAAYASQKTRKKAQK